MFYQHCIYFDINPTIRGSDIYGLIFLIRLVCYVTSELNEDTLELGRVSFPAGTESD